MTFHPIPKYSPPWRRRLRTGSFKNVPFHVEQQGRSSGRRIVEHEYPLRDMPYAEDMGRHAIRYQITGYVIQAPATWTQNPNASQLATDLAQTFPPQGSPDQVRFYADYMMARDLLIQALDNPLPGVLIDPYNVIAFLPEYGGFVSNLTFMCERYTMSESRQRGGVATFEMNFVEAGVPGDTSVTQSQQQTLQSAATLATAAAASALNGTMPTGGTSYATTQPPENYTPG